jgi:hypothetical protein
MRWTTDVCSTSATSRSRAAAGLTHYLTRYRRTALLGFRAALGESRELQHFDAIGESLDARVR